MRIPEDELLDAAEDVGRLLEDVDDLVPALRELLAIVDDAVTEAFVDAAAREGWSGRLAHPG